MVRIEILAATWTRCMEEAERIGHEMAQHGHVYRLTADGGELRLYTQPGSAAPTFTATFKAGRLTCMSANGRAEQSSIGLELFQALLPSLRQKDY